MNNNFVTVQRSKIESIMWEKRKKIFFTYIMGYFLFFIFYSFSISNFGSKLSSFLFFKAVFHFIVFGITTYLFFMYLSKKLDLVFTLFVYYLFIGFSDLFLTYSIIFTNSSFPNSYYLGELFFILSIILYLLIGLIFLLFTSRFINQGLKFQEYFPSVLIIGILLSYILFGSLATLKTITIGGEDIKFISPIMMTKFLYIGCLYFLFIGIYTFFQISLVRKNIRNLKIKRLLTVFLFGICVNYLGIPLFLIYIYHLGYSDFIILNIMTTVPLIGLLIKIIPYINIKNPSYFQPEFIKKLFVIKKGGTLIFHHDFTSINQEDNIHLFSGLITAVNIIFETNSKIKNKISSISYNEGLVVSKFHKDLHFVIIVDKTSSTMLKNFNLFINSFSEYFNRRNNSKNNSKNNPKNNLSLIESNNIELKILTQEIFGF